MKIWFLFFLFVLLCIQRSLVVMVQLILSFRPIIDFIIYYPSNPTLVVNHIPVSSRNNMYMGVHYCLTRPHRWRPTNRSDIPMNDHTIQYLKDYLGINLIKNRPKITLQEQGYLVPIQNSGRVQVEPESSYISSCMIVIYN